MKPWGSVGSTDLYRGDCLNFLEAYNGDPFSITVSSPPYNLGKEYDEIADRWGYDDWCGWLEQVLRLTRDHTIESGRLCLNVPLDTAKYGLQPVYADVVNLVRAAGWDYHTTIVWNEGNVSGTAYGSWASPSAPNVISPAEMVIVACNGDYKRPKLDKTPMITADEFKLWRIATWNIPGESAKRMGHPCPYPVKLVDRLLKLYSYKEDLVFDPFLGSGTTSVAANNLGQRSIGVDVSEAYLEISKSRLMGAQRSTGSEARVDAEGNTWVTEPLPV